MVALSAGWAGGRGRSDGEARRIRVGSRCDGARRGRCQGGEEGASETREGQDNATTRPGEDGGLHAGVRHDRGPVQEELESKKVEKLGGREQLEKRRGRNTSLCRSMVGLAGEASSDAMP
jgi:hypothetical protein